jgi:ABC-type sulfate transport system permease subunit
MISTLTQKKKTEKLNKHKDLKTEVSRMWKVGTKIVPIIYVALDTIKKGLDQKLQLLPSHPMAIKLQKITLNCTAHIIHKVLG